MQKLNVKNVVIGKQFEDSENLQKFMKIVKEKKIKVIVVETGDRVNIEKDIYFNVIWPDPNNIVKENILNNNSLVAKLNYNDFSMIFTGDIEEISEKQILEEYKNSNILKATVLKVAHHGSKTSTTEDFLEKVNPKIALIGVGKNNTFGHPNIEVIERLKSRNIELYRTDEGGEILLIVDDKERIKIKKFIE